MGSYMAECMDNVSWSIGICAMPLGKSPLQKFGIHMQETKYLFMGYLPLIFGFFGPCNYENPTYHHVPPSYRYL